MTESTEPTPSAAPTEAAPDKVKKAKYPVPATGLTEWPSDFDEKKFQPLKRGDFKDERIWLAKRAERYEAAAKEAREEIEIITQNGPGSNKKAIKVQKLQSELDALKELMIANGMDVEALLAARAAAAQ